MPVALVLKECFLLTLFSFALNRFTVLCSGKGDDDDDNDDDNNDDGKGKSDKGKSKGGSGKGNNDEGRQRC